MSEASEGPTVAGGDSTSAAAASRRRVLSPTERISEVLFGLIMVLSFTCSLSIAEAGRSEIKEMFVGAIGCNLAWGIVDAVMYLLGALLDRGRNLAILRAARGSNSAEARAAITEALPAAIADSLSPGQLDALRERARRLPEPRRRPALTADDLRGAVGVFLLVFLSTFPVVLPFAFVHEAHFALRISNGIAMAMLFFGGWKLGRHAGLSPLWTSLALVALGALLVATTISLGG